jgi:hypothetical protein
MRKQTLYKILQYLQACAPDIGLKEAIESCEYLLSLED